MSAVRIWLVSIFLLLVVGLGGYELFENQKDSFSQYIQRQLSLISDLKAQQIHSWMDERKQDMQFVSLSLAETIGSEIPKNTATIAHTLQHLKEIKKFGQYENVLILDINGKFILSSNEKKEKVSSEMKQFAFQAIQEAKPIFSSFFHHHQSNGKIFLDLHGPLMAMNKGRQRVVGTVIFRIDPSIFLYPLLQGWPTRSTTAETLLVAKDGSDVIFLNELRHKRDSALTLRIPLTKTEVPAVKAVLGEIGIVAGRDYRGVPVLASISPVLHTPWFLVSKIDQAEAYEPLKSYLNLFLGFMITIMIIVGLSMRLLWREKFVRALDEQRQKAQRFLNIAGVITSSLDSKGRIILMNKKGCETFGYQEHELHGKDWFDLCLPSRIREDIRQQFEAIVSGASEALEHFERPVVNKSGEERILSFSRKVVRDSNGKLKEILISGIDITQLKRVEADLTEAKRLAEAASRAKTDFLSNTSHEIRAPLSNVIGYGELLLETNLDDVQRGYVSTINRSGETLLELINNVLDLSRIESGQFIIEKKVFDLEYLITGVAELFEPIAYKKGLGFSVNLEPRLPKRVLGDSVRVRQILTNLLGNAFKFTSVGDISLEVRPAPGRKMWFEFIVKDTGIGIPAEKIPTLFQRFTQADGSITRRYGGTGLGLAICKELAKLMGGEITLTSEDGKGSQFILQIPFECGGRSEKSAGEKPQAGIPAIDTKTLKILVADDSEDSRTLIGLYLTSYKTFFVHDGEEAIEAFKKDMFDMVLMDMQMPVMDGMTATKIIREWEKSKGFRPVPIVALTGMAIVEEKEKILAAGCNLHLSKPIKKEDLLRILQDLMVSKVVAPSP